MPCAIHFAHSYVLLRDSFSYSTSVSDRNDEDHFEVCILLFSRNRKIIFFKNICDWKRTWDKQSHILQKVGYTYFHLTLFVFIELQHESIVKISSKVHTEVLHRSTNFNVRTKRWWRSFWPAHSNHTNTNISLTKKMDRQHSLTFETWRHECFQLRHGKMIPTKKWSKYIVVLSAWMSDQPSYSKRHLDCCMFLQRAWYWARRLDKHFYHYVSSFRSTRIKIWSHDRVIRK